MTSRDWTVFGIFRRVLLALYSRYNTPLEDTFQVVMPEMFYTASSFSGIQAQYLMDDS
jgi:hypothetical protein